MAEGRLVVCATPIGNLSDVSARLREELANADVVYAEDTRRTGKLLAHVGAKPKVRSFFVGNEKRRAEDLLADVERGMSVVLVSDAGMPTVSDPGAEPIRLAHQRGLPVVVVPGPSAVTTALAGSGFGSDRFVFEGFLPRKGKDRTARIESLAVEERTAVVFASPHRLEADLTDLLEAMGPDRRVAVMREMTKLHEEIWIGAIGEAVERWAGDTKGEVTLVVEGAPPRLPSVEEAVAKARDHVEAGMSISEAARSVAESEGVSRRVVYESLTAQEPS